MLGFVKKWMRAPGGGAGRGKINLRDCQSKTKLPGFLKASSRTPLPVPLLPNEKKCETSALHFSTDLTSQSTVAKLDFERDESSQSVTSGVALNR